MTNMNDYRFCKLGLADIDQIVEIEQAVYSHPWTRGNFLDAIYSGHTANGLRDEAGFLLGYFVLMPVLDEMHLLNLAVRAERQGQGLARILLEKMIEDIRGQQFASILLEVRVSNRRALEIYQRYGFSEIGRRKAYYPSTNNAREDAIVMRMEL